MTLNELIEKIHRSIYETNEEHKKWTGGCRITQYGVEQYIVGNIARAVMSLEKPPTYAALETQFSDIYEISEIKPQGRPRVSSKGNNRLDLTLYHGEKICYAIEFKRFTEEPGLSKDIDRLCDLVRSLGKTKGGSLRAGIFASLVTTTSAEKLSVVFDKKINKCSEYLEKKWVDKGISYSFHTATAYNINPAPEEDGRVLSSLCVVIK
jgi:hypothetical protein